MKKRLLYSPELQPFYRESPVHYIDVGARGDVGSPWCDIPSDQIEIIGFEPDPEETERLNAESPANCKYYPYGLWEKSEEIVFHLAQRPSTSSIHPPNFDVINVFEERNWKPRTTVKEFRVPCVTLDEVVAKEQFDCDFLKVDTQGSEYEIIKGSVETLKDELFGVILETWTTEVHKGQALTGDIMNLMRENGYELFDAEVSAAWHRETNNSLERKGRRQVTGIDLLFLKSSLLSQPVTDKKAFSKLIKCAALAELYGYPDFAYQLINNAVENNPSAELKEQLQLVRSTLIDNWKTQPPKAPTHQPGLLARALSKVLRSLGYNVIHKDHKKEPESEFPRLHY